MKEYSFLNRYKLNEQNDYADISFYEVSPNSSPILKTDEVELTNVEARKSMLIKVSTKSKVYPVSFKYLYITLFLNGVENTLTFNLYRVGTLGYPTTLPEKLSTLKQSIYKDIEARGFMFNISTDLTSKNSDYFYLLEPNVSEGTNYKTRINVQRYNFKMPLITVSNQYDTKLPQYLKYDNIQFENCTIDLNLYNAKFTLNRPLVMFKGQRMPMNLSYSYCNYIYDSEYINLTNNIYYSLPNNCKINYSQVIKKHFEEDKYLYINAAGEQLHFSKVKDNYYINDNGRGLYLMKKTDCYIIEDVNGNQLEFNLDGYLIYIRDNIESVLGGYEKGIKIIYTENNDIYYLTSIKDSLNRELLFTYNTSNLKLTHSNNKEILLNFTNRGVTSIIDEYGEELKFIYNTTKELVRINKDIEDLVFTSSNEGVSKIVYKLNSSAKFTKEYTYTDSSFSNITTIVSYNNQKKENNQIIKKYSFDVNGNYKSDYEEVNGQKYNENKRIENVLEVQCKINKKNNTQYVSGLEEPISAVSDILINEGNKMNCILNIDEYNNQFLKSISTNKYGSFRNERLIYSFVINLADIITSNLTPASININIYEEVNGNNKLIHSLKFKCTKTYRFYDLETKEKYGFMQLDGSYYLCMCEVPLKWDSITNENIEIKFDVEIAHITKIVIENAYVVGDKNTLPVAYFPTSSKKLLPIEDMYYYSDYNQYNNYKNDTKNILCETMYGLTNPNKIRYVKEARYELVENVKITLNEIMVNAKNKAKSKKIFWYNDFKNLIVEDNLYSNSSNPEIIFDNNECLSLTNLAFTIPMFKSENEKNYMMYNFNNVYGNDESTFIETTLKQNDDNTILANIVIKDVYGRILKEEQTDRRVSTSDNFYEDNYISTIKEYQYDNNNNIIKELLYTRNIYDESFDDINYDNYTEIEYTYDSNNNMISKKVNDVEILYEYDNNNNLVKINYPLGTNKFFTYDSKDRLINTFVSNNVKEMKNVITYDSYNRIEKLFYNGEKSGYKYTYNNNKEIESIYKINNTNEYEKLIENYQLVENNNNEYNLNLLDDQYALIVTDIMNNKIAQIYDKYGKILYLKKYENDAFVLKKQFVYKDGVTLDETKTFETLVDYIIDYDENYRYEYSYNDENELILINKYEIDIHGSTENLVLSKSYEYFNGKLFRKFTDEFILQYNYGRYDLLQQYFIIYNGQSLLYNEYEYSNDGFIKNKKIHHNNNVYTANYTYNDNKLIKYKKPYSQEEEILSYDYESKVTSINSLQNVNYTYNKFGHLVEEINEELGEKYTYEYDQAGNIISKKIYSLNNSLEDEIYYTYGEPNYDILTKINKNGVEFIIQYNENLEPKFIGNDQIEWNNKRPIKYSKGNDEYYYYYNVDGIRYKKALNKTIDEIIEYNLDGDKIISENRKVKVNDEYVDNLTLKYLYEGNNILGFIYKKNNQETLYMYEKDALNTIKAIYKVTNTIEKVAIYKYNAWGEHIVCNPNGTLNTQNDFIGNVNPFRYRGYYYDAETGLFWLSSRYYSPELCRFISPDSVDYLDPSSINGLNLYAYCNNDPINYADPSGHVAISIGLLLAIGGIVGAVIGAGASVAGQYLANGCSWENFSWGQLALDTVLGGVSGMLSMSPLGWGTMIAANAGIGFVGAVGGHLINGSDFSKLSTWVDIGLSTGLGALVGVVGGPGALNAGYLNGAKQTAGFIRAAGLYDDVLTKAVTGFYRTPGIASNALRLSGQNLVKQWNKMVVSQAGKALTKALAYGGTALLIGTAGKGWLYDLYNDYF